MGFKIYGKTEPAEQTIFLKLDGPNANGNIVLKIVGSNGERIDGGALIVFEKNGDMQLCSGVNDTIGLQLDDNDRLNFKHDY